MLAHRGYTNRLEWMQKTFPLAEGDRVAQKTSCCFDISIWEIFWPLMVGATACPVQRDIVRNPWNLAQWLNQTQIDVMHFVPSLFGEFINALAGEEQKFPHLRWLIFSGEALPIPFIQDWCDRYGAKTGLANLYGPTEASIDVSCHIIRQRPGERGETSIPIGQAIDNVDLLLLDQNQQPVIPGQLGELWIGGVQLAQGYLKDPERTAKTFCSNQFPQIAGKSLHRTGDLAKQLPDGSFEYHGRIDNQVKIRGFRIELGEVENVLLLHPGVKEAAVVVVDLGSGQKRLVAGLVGDWAQPTLYAERYPLGRDRLDTRQMKQFLRLHLPDYMIPHQLEWFASLPKNHNGKLDRKALLALVRQEDVPSPTSTPTEEYLPLGSAQKWLLRYFDAPYQWAGYTRCLYHQPLDLEIFNQALNCLIERHWALRTLFVQREGQWWQRSIQPSVNSLIATTQNRVDSKQVAVITGAGQGINRAIALKLATQIQETIDQIQQSGGQGMAITADISNLEQVQKAFDRVVRELGQIDILINSAGITELETLANSTPVKWQQIVEVNVFGTYYCCHTAIPYLLQQGKGKIVNLGADYSFVDDPLKSAYTTSKHGVEGLTKSLSEELKQQNIQVNTVCLVDTNLTSKAFLDNSIPLEQIAEVVSFLVSSGADSITGECLKVSNKEIFVQDSQNTLESLRK